MVYEQPVISDFGDLLDLTAASGLTNVEDGVGKRIQAGVGGVVGVSVGVLP